VNINEKREAHYQMLLAERDGANGKADSLGCTIMADIGEIVHLEMFRQGMDEETLSLLSGVSEPTIRRIRYGTRTVTLPPIRRVAKALGIRFRVVFQREPQEQQRSRNGNGL